MTKFIPRKISADGLARGYNNERQGKLIGYIADPKRHEKTCRYVISTGGNPDKNPHESCTCRIGLWQRPKPRVRVKAGRSISSQTRGTP